MMRFALLLLFALSTASCVSTQQTTDSTPSNPDAWGGDEESRPEVWNMRLSQTWGEVGKPFKSDLKVHDRNMKDREYSVSGLPPGLRFDPVTGTIVGVPKRRGFFAVHVAVRQSVEDRPFRYAKHHDRWFTEDFEVRIYNQLD